MHAAASDQCEGRA